MNRSCTRSRQGGFSLIDVMVGIVIALVAMLVVYQVFAVGEGFKRNTTSIGEAQVNGLLASFALGLQLANSGNALATAAQDLDACDYPAAGPWKTRFATSWRPLPIVIADSGAPGTPDSFAVGYSTSTTIVVPALVIDAGGTYVVQSPNGFHAKASGDFGDDMIVAIEKTPFSAVKGQCVAARVTKVDPSNNPKCTSAQGCVDLTITGTPLANPYSVFSMGTGNDAQKIAYDIDTTKNVLRSTLLLDPQGQLAVNPVPNPIASNIVNMKLQYGIDTNGDGMLDTWQPATGIWDKDALMSSPTSIAMLNQIKAVRIGVIVQSEQFDKNYTQDVPWSMFDGTVTGTFLKSVSPPGNWRYRVYETVIPLRNEIWNKQS
jgi:type IV pilus assembly protein PilW